MLAGLVFHAIDTQQDGDDVNAALLRLEADSGSVIQAQDRALDLYDAVDLWEEGGPHESVRSSLVALDDLLASTNAAGTRVSDLVGPAFVCVLDRFKLVNDTLGHRTGDELLQAVGQRLWTTVEGSGTRIFRLGGDEFVDVESTRSIGVEAMGVRLALDDFGTGYSTIVRLTELPVDVFKLDRALVAGVAAGDDAAFGILSAAVALVTHAGLEIVVEGVETQSELDAVRQLGCTIVQGYLFRRPGPAHEVLDEERTSGGLGSDRGGATGATRSNWATSGRRRCARDRHGRVDPCPRSVGRRVASCVVAGRATETDPTMEHP